MNENEIAGFSINLYHLLCFKCDCMYIENIKDVIRLL